MTITSILLLGKSGVGKSATGNSILNCRAFHSKGGTQAGDSQCRKDICELEDTRYLEVVDTPGVADTGYSEEDGKKMFMGAITQAIAMSPYGYHALIYTLKYGNRLTKEDVDVFMYLKRQFGDTFLKQHGIVVMTCGDQFQDEVEEGSGMTFPQWCQQQTGLFQSIYQEVNGRFVLFDNHKRCPELKKVTQRQKLVDLIGQTPFINEQFGKAQEANTNHFRGAKCLRDGVRNEYSLILAKYEQILNDSKFPERVEEESLKGLMERVLKLFYDINKEKNKPSLLQSLENLVKQTLESVRRKPFDIGAVRHDIRRLRDEFNQIRDVSDTMTTSDILAQVNLTASATPMTKPKESKMIPHSETSCVSQTSTGIPRKTLIYLLGKSSSGKSSTGNTILGRREFRASSSTTDSEQDIQTKQVPTGSRLLEVVDGPGLVQVDIGFSQAAIDKFYQVWAANFNLSHVFLIIYRYGELFSKTDATMISMIERRFGKNVLKHHGIVVVTCGDNFLNDKEDEGVTFDMWCKQQRGDFVKLLQKCGDRRLLVDNKCKQKQDFLGRLGNMMEQINYGETKEKKGKWF